MVNNILPFKFVFYIALSLSALTFCNWDFAPDNPVIDIQRFAPKFVFIPGYMRQEKSSQIVFGIVDIKQNWQVNCEICYIT